MIGLEGATTFCTAAATYGLIAGGIIGGPMGDRLIRSKDLLKTASAGKDVSPAEEKVELSFDMLGPAVSQLIFAAGVGTFISWLLSQTGLKFPIYIGAMIVAAVLRNISEYTGKFRIRTGEINVMSGIFLNLFLGIAMLTLKLWQLAELALPLILLLAVQTIFILFFVRFVVFTVMGHDYDAAVFSAGTCGLGLGATPTAMGEHAGPL